MPTLRPNTKTDESYNETQQRILDSAVECVKQWGIDKTNLNDIAKHAGVTRPTVYSYFASKDEVIRAALLQSGYEFATRAQKHLSKYTKTRDRLIEAVMFAIEELPKEPYLAVITQADLSSFINEDALSDVEGQMICFAIFRDIFIHESVKDKELEEFAEFTTRILLSLLMLKGPKARTSKDVRAFLRRRLLPAVGL